MKRLFITEIDTPLARRITEKFGNTKEYEIIGTTRSKKPLVASSNDLPYVTEVVPCYADDATEFKRRVLEADVIICPLRDSTLEADAAIKMLANTAFETEKNFVLISTTLTWSNTYAAQRAEERAEKLRERQAAIEAGEEPPAEEEEEEPEEKPTYGDDGYQKRVPHQRYQHWRDLEHFTKTANSETLHTNVIFSGLQYGREADGVLHDIFRSAWHGQPLPLFTDGANVVPMIHMEDLANLAFKIGGSSEVVPQRYILGVDRGNCTLKAVIQAVNDTLGSGEVYFLPPAQLAVIPFAEWMTVDLRMEPSAAFEIVEESEWIAPEGFVATIERVADEYRKFRHVQPLRSVIVGPPRSGKSHLAKTLAQEYRVQHLTVPDVIDAYEANLTEMNNELQRLRKARRDAKAAAAAEEARKAKEESGEGEKNGAAGDGEPKDDEDGTNRVQDPSVGDLEDGDGNGGMSKSATSGAAGGDDVSDIDFDEPLPALDGHSHTGGDDGAAGDEPAAGHGGEDAGADADEDEDEKIAKLKEDIATTQKVLRLKLKSRLNFASKSSATAAGGAGEDGEAEENAAGGDGEHAAADEDPEVAAARKAQLEAADPFIRYRFADEALATMIRWRLGRKDCKNQGYILDGFPKTVRQAMLTFTAGELTIPELEELQSAAAEASSAPPNTAGEEGALNPVDEKLLPEQVICLSASEALLLARSTEDTGDVTVKPPEHASTANTLRRLSEYKWNHTASLRPSRSTSVWLKSILTAASEVPSAPVVRGVSALDLDANRLQSDFNEVLESTRSFLGGPRFYRPTPEEIRDAVAAQEVQQEAARLEAIQAQEELEKQEQRRQEIIHQENEKHRRRYTSVQQEQKEAERVRDLRMHDYLMQFVVPVLTEGIQKTAQMRPADPIEALADYLFFHQARNKV